MLVSDTQIIDRCQTEKRQKKRDGARERRTMRCLGHLRTGEWGRPRSLQDVVVRAALEVCRRDWASEPPAPVRLGRKAKMQLVVGTYPS